jgi:hypothetical protein
MVETEHRYTFPLHWVQQGTVHWEQWWLDRAGPTRSHIPGLDDHLGFLNFDLGVVSGVYRWSAERDGMSLMLCLESSVAIDPDDQLGLVGSLSATLKRHGFSLEPRLQAT